MTTWAVWPIFILQLIAFGLLFFAEKTFFLRIRIQYYVWILLFIVCAAVGFSLYHDSTDALHLYF